MKEFNFVMELTMRVIHTLAILLGGVFIIATGPDRIFDDPLYTLLVIVFAIVATDWRN